MTIREIRRIASGKPVQEELVQSLRALYLDEDPADLKAILNEIQQRIETGIVPLLYDYGTRYPIMNPESKLASGIEQAEYDPNYGWVVSILTKGQTLSTNHVGAMVTALFKLRQKEVVHGWKLIGGLPRVKPIETAGLRSRIWLAMFRFPRLVYSLEPCPHCGNVPKKEAEKRPYEVLGLVTGAGATVYQTDWLVYYLPIEEPKCR